MKIADLFDRIATVITEPFMHGWLFAFIGNILLVLASIAEWIPSVIQVHVALCLLAVSLFLCAMSSFFLAWSNFLTGLKQAIAAKADFKAAETDHG